MSLDHPGQVFMQIFVIPIGTNCVPLLADNIGSEVYTVSALSVDDNCPKQPKVKNIGNTLFSAICPIYTGQKF